MINMLEDLKDNLLHNDLTSFIRHLCRFIKRLVQWMPTIWKNENWDYEYLYDLIELKLKEFLTAQEQDIWHVAKETKRRAKQIKICLAYLDRYRNWPKYYDYPMDDIIWERCENPNLSRMVCTNKLNEIKRKGAHAYIQFNYDMFWKRFMQWHQGWWT